MMERFRKAVAPLPVRIVDESVVYAQFSSLKIIGLDRLCFQFIKEDIYFLVRRDFLCQVHLKKLLFAKLRKAANLNLVGKKIIFCALQVHNIFFWTLVLDSKRAWIHF